ncbi:MAG: thiamine phosphate synthase [Vicinamibacterales bacterium]
MSLPRLYAVVDHEASRRAGCDPLELARAFVAGGARLLQVRAKGLPAADLLAVSEAVVAAGAAHGARTIVNDRADVASLAGAAGVHVGQDDLPASAARGLLGPGALVGVSTHSVQQAREALGQPVSYVAVGPVFGTTTKDTGYAPVGLSLVREVAALAAPLGIPVVAIGGITLESAPEVIRAGAASVCVITDLLRGDPAARVRAYIDTLSSLD